MNCAQAEPLLSDLLDGELPEDAREGVESHIAACARCAGDFRALRRTVRFVRARARVAMTPNTPGGVYEEFNRAIADPASDTDPLAVMLKGLALDVREVEKGDQG